MKTKPRMLAPSECNTQAKVNKLKSSYVDTPCSWISAEGGRVTINSYGHQVYLTVADMRKFARWFFAEAEVRKVIREMFNQAHVLYQTADNDNEISNSALAVSVDSCGTLVITQEDRDIVLNMATVPELCKLLKQLAASK